MFSSQFLSKNYKFSFKKILLTDSKPRIWITPSLFLKWVVNLVAGYEIFASFLSESCEKEGLDASLSYKSFKTKPQHFISHFKKSAINLYDFNGI